MPEQSKKYTPDKQDILFVSGAVLVVSGIALHHSASALIAAGIFLLFAPVLDVVSGFFKGLRG
jgi:hypothetical protein